jgi:hypothetical protein
MTRLFLCAIVIGFCPSLASGQTADVFCRFDDTQGVVICIQGDESRPIFRYEIAYSGIGMLSKLSSTGGGSVPASADRERCRMLAEGFRVQQLEGKLNSSLEGLRMQAESVRAASEDNLVLYKQIMLVYDALFGRYKSGLQAYQDAVRTCHVTPYDVRPDRI